MDKPVKILFVCTGNTCRSSMAEAMGRHAAEKETWQREAEIFSAGTNAFDGSPASSLAVQAMKEKKLDLSRHRARRISPELLAEADYIFTMTEFQRQHLLYLYPAGAEKIFLLKTFAADSLPENKNSADIADPFGGDLAAYHRSAGELEEAVYGALKKVLG